MRTGNGEGEMLRFFALLGMTWVSSWGVVG